MSFKTRRVFAYIFDVLAISLISSAISMSGLNPNITKIEKLEEEYSVKAKEYNDAISDITDTETYEDDIIRLTEEYNEYYQDTLYESAKLSWFRNCTVIITTVLYFGVFAYFFKGETVGKRLAKIRIVDKDGSDVSFVKLLFRTVILYGLVITVLNLIFGQMLGKDAFIIMYNILYYVSFALEIAIVSTMIIRKDGRGLHDMIAGTKVIDVKEN